MGNIRAKPSGKLYFDFRYLGKRCREITELADTLANRKRLDVVMRRIEAEILTGTFSYESYFPNSSFLGQIQLEQKRANQGRLGEELPTFEWT